MVVVDGPGSEADGDRNRAEKVADELLANNEHQENIAYQRLRLKDGGFDLQAALGGYFVYWVAENSILRPIPGYIGVDESKKLEAETLSRSSLDDVRYVMMTTDGGMQLVLHPDVINPAYGLDVQEMIRAIERLGEDPNTFKKRGAILASLLKEFTSILHRSGINGIVDAYRPYMNDHRDGDAWLNDDATFALIKMK